MRIEFLVPCTAKISFDYSGEEDAPVTLEDIIAELDEIKRDGEALGDLSVLFSEDGMDMDMESDYENVLESTLKADHFDVRVYSEDGELLHQQLVFPRKAHKGHE